MVKANLRNTALDFAKSLRHLKSLERDSALAMLRETLVAITEDANVLLVDKFKPIGTSLVSAVAKMAETLLGLVVDYHGYTIANEDVALIKTGLVMYKDHHKLAPLTDNLKEAVSYVDEMLGEDKVLEMPEWGETKDKALKACSQAIAQVAAAAICTAIYVTRQGRASFSTKIQSLQATKAHCTAKDLGAPVPIELLKRLEVALAELKKEKKDAEEAAEQKKKPKGGAKRKR